MIEDQKKVAKEILSKLECADPHAILAGGAPRNWYFGKEANDLDFYVYLPQTTCSYEQLRWRRLGLNIKRVPYEQREHNKYKMMPDLFRLYEGVCEGIKFQVMVMSKPTFQSVLPFFGTSICKAWWKGSEVKTTTEFLMSVFNKKVYIAEGYLETDYHITKMKDYFPDYSFVNYGCLRSDSLRLEQRTNIHLWSIKFQDYLRDVVK